MVQSGGRGTPVTMSIKNADLTLKTFPKTAARPANTAVPAGVAYAVSIPFSLYTPVAVIRDFGKPSATENSRVLETRNEFKDLRINGFEPSDVQTSTDQDMKNDYRTTAPEISVPGGFTKFFGGVVGTPGNSSPQEFSNGDAWHGEGPPGGSQIRSGETTVAPTQEIVSILTATGPRPTLDATVSTIMCDSWDATKMHLKAKNWLGADYGTRSGIKTGFGRGIPSEGKAVWVTGYNNVLRADGRNVIDALTPDQAPTIKVQYSGAPISGRSDSACGDDKGPWVDDPSLVPNNDPDKARQGIYTAVSRVRAHVVLPPAVGKF